MPARSTRKLIKDRTDCVIRELDNCMYYLYDIVDKAKKRSPHITENVPYLAGAVYEVKKAVLLFREKL